MKYIPLECDLISMEDAFYSLYIVCIYSPHQQKQLGDELIHKLQIEDVQVAPLEYNAKIQGRHEQLAFGLQS